jgi:ribosomal protein S18 acetylase RimI-like enzyme
MGANCRTWARAGLAGHGVGRISGLGVLNACRRRGIGALLLKRALGFLRARDCRRVTCAAHEYYVAGLDREAYPEGLRFLSAQGFTESYEAVAMGRRLYDLAWPAVARDAEAVLLRAGVQVKHYSPDDGDATVSFLRAEFPGWIEFFVRKLDARDPGDDIVIVRTKDAVAGYCQRLEADHVGPFGVAAVLRNRGAGTVMLYRLLERMRQKGYRFAWFGETGRAKTFYERAGFTVTRRYAVMEKDLAHGD